MKNLVRFAVAGVLFAGFQTVQAQALPSSDASDLWLFVSDQSAGTTFAEDTGISVASLLPSGSLVSGATLSTAIADSINLGPSSALAAYIAANGASNLEWGIEGVNFNGSTATKPQKAGSIVGITDNPASQEFNTSQLIDSALQTWANGYQSDTQYVDGTYVAGGQTYKFSAGSTAGNVWGSTGPGGQAGSTNLYGQGPDQSGIGLGTSAVFYGLTGNNGTGQVQSYILASQLELTATGTLETVATTTAVPLPAAAWLIGSGLLGLAGVGRRRKTVA
jgi:hypothetical protein